MKEKAKTIMNLLDKPISGIFELKKLLPQREPMILVDALIFHDAEKSISELKIVESNVFVDSSMLMEAGMIENMAQTAALHVGYKYSLKNSTAREGYIAAIQNASIFQLPKVGETLKTEIHTDFELGNIQKVSIKTYLEGKIIALANMTTILKKGK